MTRYLALPILVVLALAAPAAAAAKPAYSTQDQTYLTSAISGDRFEVQGGQMAANKTTNPKVKALAERLVTDHSKSLTEATALARRLGIKAPTAPTPPETWEIQISGTLAEPAFNHWWSDLEVQDHKQDIEESTTEKRGGSNKQVKKLAAGEIPTLRTHLKLSDEALSASPG